MTAAELDGFTPTENKEPYAHVDHIGNEEKDALTEADGSLYGAEAIDGGWVSGSDSLEEGITDGASHEDGALQAAGASDKDDFEDTGGTAGEKASDMHREDGEEDSTPPREASLAESEEYYERLMASDISALKAEFPELRELTDIRELAAPIRYAELRDLGLTAAEAYLLTARRSRSDTRGHLSPAFKVGAASPSGSMTRAELSAARDLFPDLSDSEIQRLYRTVTK